MSRITWYFDGTPNDGVLLYDQAGREVARFFLAAGVPPTPLPGTTPPPASTQAPPATATPAPQTTPVPGASATPTATATLPGPQTTGQPTATATATPTTGTPGTPTATATPGAVPTGTPTPRVFGDGTTLTAWVDVPDPEVGEEVELSVLVTQNGTPVAGANMAAFWSYPAGVEICDPAVTNTQGLATCLQVMPEAARGQVVTIDVQVRRAATPTVYTVTTAVQVRP
jgi:hypothetical protein